MLKEMTLREKQLVELEILKYVNKICINHKISYCLIFGSLLGAVRHKGFIPWDGDIDVGLFRPDYDKLLALLLKDKHYDLYMYGIHGDKLNYFYTTVKVVNRKTVIISNDSNGGKERLGVYIDLYAIDGMPDNYLTCKIYNYLLGILVTMKSISDWEKIPKSNTSNFRKIGKIVAFCLCKTLGSTFINNLYNYFACMFKLNNDTKYCCTKITANEGCKLIMPVNIMKEKMDILFEGEEFPGLKNYDYYLKRIYGNYMEEVKTEYDEKVYWIDN